jgi:hypothetical protein
MDAPPDFCARSGSTVYQQVHPGMGPQATDRFATLLDG